MLKPRQEDVLKSPKTILSWCTFIVVLPLVLAGGVCESESPAGSLVPVACSLEMSVDVGLPLIADVNDPCLCRSADTTLVLPTFDEELGAVELEAYGGDVPCDAGVMYQLGTCGDGEWFAIRRRGATTVTRYYDPFTRQLVGITTESANEDSACGNRTFQIARIECDDFVVTRDICEVPEFFYLSGFRFGPACEDFSVAGEALVRDVEDPCLCRFLGDEDMLPTFEERLQSAREGAAIGETCTSIPTAYRTGVCNGGEVLFIGVSGGFAGAISYFSADTGRLIGMASFTDVLDGVCGDETFQIDRVDVFDCETTEILCPESD